MYEDYFGLQRPPFKITPDTSLFYEGGKRGDILAALVYAIQRGEGIVKVVGEVGSGKTMLCRMLQLKLPESVEIVYIANPSVSPEDILFVIAHELSLPVSREASKHKVMHSLQDYLLKRHTENKQVVLFVEEAQGMPLETLEEIRLLSNLETDQNKLLQIILFGQPELDENLSKQSIRQLRERITHNFHLEPLTREEIYTYLNFRMREVGYRGPELINRAVAKKVEQHSGGLLRRINIIADKILLSAYAEGTHNLSAKHVDAAVNDSAFDSAASRRGGAIWWFALLLLAALLFALYQTRGEWLSAAAAAVDPDRVRAHGVGVAIADVESRRVAARQAAGAGAGETAAHHGHGMPMPADGVETAIGAGPVAGKTSTRKLAETATDTVNPGEKLKVAVQTGQSMAAGEQSPSPRPPSAVDTKARGPAPTADDGRQRVNATATALQPAVDAASAVGDGASDPAAQPEDEYGRWLDAKLEQSREWLSGADGSKVSIQVMMRKKSAARELVYHLLNDWPLDLSRTYVYELNLENRSIYRVLYSEFDTVALGKRQIGKLPDSVKNNSPYLHSIHRLQKGLL
jgi:type II secretory pathway predicted ATPase ExeA